MANESFLYGSEVFGRAPQKSYAYLLRNISELLDWTRKDRGQTDNEPLQEKMHRKMPARCSCARGGIAARAIEVAHVAAARAVRVTTRATNLETENAKILIMAPEALGLRITDLKLVTS